MKKTGIRIMRVGVCLLALLLGSRVQAQGPRINTFYPIGGRTGSTVDVEIRGSGLDGADGLLVQGTGVSGSVSTGGDKVDNTFRPLWQSKCGTCHELRSPANRSMSPPQWAATVDRMVKVRNAPISADESSKITQFLMSAARTGKLTAQIKIAGNASPGVRELRVLTPHGVSTAGLFEIGRLPEIMAVKNVLDSPLEVTLPCVANGSLSANGERHYFRFAAKSGQRLVFDLKGFRYNVLTQEYFNPELRLHGVDGKEIAENHGYYALDPLLDWTCPADGNYTLEVRDLVGHGNPGDVYRLTMGALPYDIGLYPPAAQARTKASLRLIGKNTSATPLFTVDIPGQPGIGRTDTPSGPQLLYVSSHPVVTLEAQAGSTTNLPACFAGHLATSGEAQNYTIHGGGGFLLETYSERLGSPGQIQTTLLDPSGRALNKHIGDGAMPVVLEPSKTYTLRVEGTPETQGQEVAYAIEAGPQHPELDLVVRPANVTVRPGTTTVIEVLLLRRNYSTGNISITAEGMPAGVTVKPEIISPEQSEVFLSLTADASAPLSQSPFRIVATATGPGGTAASIARPQELFTLNNNLFPIDRATSALAVRGQADFTGEILSGNALRVYQQKGMPVKVRITRKPDFHGPVVVRIEGLPQGWVANQETIDPARNEATLTVRPDGNNPEKFLKRDAGLPPIHAFVEAASDDLPMVLGTLDVRPPEQAEGGK